MEKVSVIFQPGKFFWYVSIGKRNKFPDLIVDVHFHNILFKFVIFL